MLIPKEILARAQTIDQLELRIDKRSWPQINEKQDELLRKYALPVPLGKIEQTVGKTVERVDANESELYFYDGTYIKFDGSDEGTDVARYFREWEYPLPLLDEYIEFLKEMVEWSKRLRLEESYKSALEEVEKAKAKAAELEKQKIAIGVLVGRVLP